MAIITQIGKKYIIHTNYYNLQQPTIIITRKLHRTAKLHDDTKKMDNSETRIVTAKTGKYDGAHNIFSDICLKKLLIFSGVSD